MQHERGQPSSVPSSSESDEKKVVSLSRGNGLEHACMVRVSDTEGWRTPRGRCLYLRSDVTSQTAGSSRGEFFEARH